MKERVEKWFRHNNKLPEAILLYRDGVSETQFPMVKDLEFDQIRRGFELAASAIEPKDTKINLRNQKVKITLLVVGKRHHTRFYPREENDDRRNDDRRNNDRRNDDRKNNPAGLVVNSVITDPNQFSFYLQSHHSPIGTARSAHYFVIRNEMSLTASDLYKFVS